MASVSISPKVAYTYKHIVIVHGIGNSAPNETLK